MSDGAGQVHRLACLELCGGSHVRTYAARLPGLTAWVSCNPLQPSRRGAIPLDRNPQAVVKETADGIGRFLEVQR